MNQPEEYHHNSQGAISESRVMPSHLSADEFLKLLDASVIKNRKGSAMSAVHNIGGRVFKDKFVLTKLATFKNGFSRDLHGAVVPLENGSEIVYRFELNMIVRLIFSLWFILVIVLLLAGIVSIFSSQLRLELIVGPLFLLGGGIMLINFAINKGRQEESELEKFLFQVANSRTFNQG